MILLLARFEIVPKDQGKALEKALAKYREEYLPQLHVAVMNKLVILSDEVRSALHCGPVVYTRAVHCCDQHD